MFSSFPLVILGSNRFVHSPFQIPLFLPLWDCSLFLLFSRAFLIHHTPLLDYEMYQWYPSYKTERFIWHGPVWAGYTQQRTSLNLLDHPSVFVKSDHVASCRRTIQHNRQRYYGVHFPFALPRPPHIQHYTIQCFAHYFRFFYHIFNVGYHSHVLEERAPQDTLRYHQLQRFYLRHRPYFPTPFKNYGICFSAASCSWFSFNHGLLYRN